MAKVNQQPTGQSLDGGPILARRIPDAARAIGVSRATIYRMAAAKQLQILHIAGRAVVPEIDLVRIAQEGAAL
jgi:hypothetical protein